MPGSRYFTSTNTNPATSHSHGDRHRAGTRAERQDAVEQVTGDEEDDRRQDDDQRLDDQPADLAAPIVDGVELRLERGVVERVDPAQSLRGEDVTHGP